MTETARSVEEVVQGMQAELQRVIERLGRAEARNEVLQDEVQRLGGVELSLRTEQQERRIVDGQNAHLEQQLERLDALEHAMGSANPLPTRRPSEGEPTMNSSPSSDNGHASMGRGLTSVARQFVMPVPKFTGRKSGSTEVGAWLFAMERLFEQLDITGGAVRISMGASHLTELAIAWYESMWTRAMSEQRRPFNDDWMEFSRCGA